MLMQASRERPTSAHVIVMGNEKGGAGKSTIAMHVAVGLMNFGQRVATIDLDLRQKTLTHYVENRRVWAKHSGSSLGIPTHFCVARGSTQNLEDNETIEFAGFVDALTAVEQGHDFIVVDTAGIGSTMAANKVAGVRCALCHDDVTVVNAREHNDANVLALGSRVVHRGAAVRMVRLFLTTAFAGGRHARRVQKIMALEGPR